MMSYNTGQAGHKKQSTRDTVIYNLTSISSSTNIDGRQQIMTEDEYQDKNCTNGNQQGVGKVNLNKLPTIWLTE